MEWLWWLGGGCCGATVLVAIAAIAWFAVADMRKKNRILREGDRVTAWLVQANMKLFEKGFLDQPALVVISPDEKTSTDKDFMIDLADRIMELKWIDPDDCATKDEALVAELMFDETYVEGKRDRLPLGFTEGREVYLAHIFVYRNDLPREFLRRRRLSCAIIWDDPTALICTCPPSPRKRPVDDDVDDDDDGHFREALRR
jgi:hypothetical protein